MSTGLLFFRKRCI